MTDTKVTQDDIDAFQLRVIDLAGDVFNTAELAAGREHGDALAWLRMAADILRMAYTPLLRARNCLAMDEAREARG